MIETLVNLKGGKSKSNQNTDEDAAMRMKKFLNSLGRKRRGKHHISTGLTHSRHD